MFLVMFILLGIANFPSLLYYISLNQDTSTYICTSTPQITLLRDLIAALLRVIIPLILKLILDTFLIHKMFKVRLQILNHTIDRSLRKEYKFAFTTIILNMVFIFTDLSQIMGLVFINIYGYNQTYISTTSDASAIASFVFVCITLVTLLLNFCLLFFVNIITNTVYRKEFRNFLRI
jgi:hypothetical protein